MTHDDPIEQSTVLCTGFPTADNVPVPSDCVTEPNQRALIDLLNPNLQPKYATGTLIATHSHMTLTVKESGSPSKFRLISHRSATGTAEQVEQ